MFHNIIRDLEILLESFSTKQMPLNFIVSQFIVWGAVTLFGVPLAVLLFEKRIEATIQWLPKNEQQGMVDHTFFRNPCL